MTLLKIKLENYPDRYRAYDLARDLANNSVDVFILELGGYVDVYYFVDSGASTASKFMSFVKRKMKKCGLSDDIIDVVGYRITNKIGKRKKTTKK